MEGCKGTWVGTGMVCYRSKLLNSGERRYKVNSLLPSNIISLVKYKKEKKTTVTEIYQTCQNNPEQLFSLTDLSHLFYQLFFWLLCGKLPVMNLCSVTCEQALRGTGGALELGENDINQAISIFSNFLTTQYGDHGKQHV